MTPPYPYDVLGPLIDFQDEIWSEPPFNSEPVRFFRSYVSLHPYREGLLYILKDRKFNAELCKIIVPIQRVESLLAVYTREELDALLKAELKADFLLK